MDFQTATHVFSAAGDRQSVCVAGGGRTAPASQRLLGSAPRALKQHDQRRAGRLVGVLLGAVLSLALLSGVAIADDAGQRLDEAEAAFESGDFERAYQIVEGLAAEGHPGGQYNLALVHYLGLRGEPDFERGLETLRAAGRNGSGDAQLLLGEIYGHTGAIRGVERDWLAEQDRRESYKWFLQAEQSGQEQIRSSAERILNQLISELNDQQIDEFLDVAEEHGSDEWRQTAAEMR